MPAWYAALEKTNRNAESQNDPRPMKAVAATQRNVVQTRNGIRLRARSVIAPSVGDRTKMIAYEIDWMVPNTRPTCSAPTARSTKCG